jgi:methylenetetrahydrofolate--tRNA-(uracil-5-)-methyltransferase
MIHSNPDSHLHLVESISMETNLSNTLTIIGGGLAGSEAAWQAARAGVSVRLFEMRPNTSTGAHKTDGLAELICSNSLGSNLPDRATGVLLNELRQMGSLLIEIADATSVPAGGALAVDREVFSQKVTTALEEHSNIDVIREEVTSLPAGPCVVASGPLTSAGLLGALREATAEDSLYFYDAIAPVIYKDSINMDIAFKASRYDRGQEEEGDYINCPFTQEEYEAFIDALLHADRIELRGFEEDIQSGVKAGAGFFFERCLPVEVLAARGPMAMAYGPMRPVGVTNPRTGRWPKALVQLRQDDLKESIFNMVGFQTNLTFPEQKRVFRMIPGLEQAEFARYGQMHRNTFLCSPRFLLPTLQHKNRDDLFFAGQLVGVEGYAGNIASGLVAGINAARRIKGAELYTLPVGTMTGALLDYISHANPDQFQPMKANFGLLPAPVISHRIAKREKFQRIAAAAGEELNKFMHETGWGL